MSPQRLILRSLTHHWRIHLAVALGVAAATAVLIGALLVGDSVRGSLRSLTLDRLGRIDEVLVTDRFFADRVVTELEQTEAFQAHYGDAVAAILFPQATVEAQERAGFASDVLVVGSDSDFWQLDRDGVRPKKMPGEGEIVINQTLADDWGGRVGDQVTLRLPEASQVPADSPLAHKTGRVRGLPRLEIVDIVPAEGLGRFRLRASQELPRNVYVALETIRGALDQEDRVNTILVSGKPAAGTPDAEASRALQAALRLSLSDYGFSINRVRRTFDDDVVYDYFHVTTDRMIFSPAAERAVGRAFSPYQGQGLLTYLANSIELVSEGQSEERAEIPYSTVTAIELTEHFELRDTDDRPIGSLSDDEVVLNSWAAEDLGAEPGDRIRVKYFEPETAHGRARESAAEFQLGAVTPLTEPSRPYSRRRSAVYEERPRLANDPNLTPKVAGVTDEESIEDWDPPFPFDYGRVRGEDDEYWEKYRTTPKAFISLAAGQQIWGSRFGDRTSYRIPAREGLTAEELERAFLKELEEENAALGFSFIPVKRRQLEASSGTTPFDALFLGLSIFIIAAALMLVALLFRLGVERRAGELGILLAVGLRRRQAARLLVAEGAVVAAAGGILGLLVGIGYAWLMLVGLRTWWVGAITTPFLQFHYTSRSLVLGYLAGVFVSLLTIACSVRRTRRINVRRLLAGQASESDWSTFRTSRWTLPTAIGLVLFAVTLSILATGLGGMKQGGAFIAAGAALLGGLLLLVWRFMKQGGRSRAATLVGGWGLAKLALRNAARNPSRSVITIGLMATASFLIVAMSSFRLTPTSEGAGGFDLIAESAQPVFEDLNTQEGRDELLADQADVLAGGKAFGLRLRAGDDASCNNLYRPSEPRIIGITPAFVEYFDDPQSPSFSWAMTGAETEAERANPWRLLESEEPQGAIPVVIDINTAMYSLGLDPWIGATYEANYDGQTLQFRVVGYLENSVLQGGLMVSESALERAFPEVSGYTYFMIRSPEDRSSEAVSRALEERLSDLGFDAIPTARVLEQLLAVQNTYLSTFQSLGALGLLLGTFGLATVQMRNVLERQGELGLLRAAGFRRRRLAETVLFENLCLLVLGLATGVVAALLAVLPHKFVGETSIPWGLLRDLALMLGAVLIVGVISSLVTVRATLKMPILAALRSEA